MTPIRTGTCRRLGLRRPEPPVELGISPDLTAFTKAMKDFTENLARLQHVPPLRFTATPRRPPLAL